MSAGSPLTDFIVFARPASSARHIDLDLPGDNLGVRGVFRLRLARLDEPQPPAKEPVASTAPAPLPAKPVAPPPAPQPDDGPTYVVASPVDKPVPLAISEDYLKTYIALTTVGDAGGELRSKGVVVRVTRPLPVHRERSVRGIAYVRPAVGDHKGRLMYVEEKGLKSAK